MTVLGTPVAKTLGGFNVGLAAAVGLINPLAFQIDALLSVGLGPFQLELALQLNATLALQASLSLQISDPLAGLKLALSAVAQLQAALSASLTLPTISLSLSAELTASASISAALTARLGLLSIAISIALRLKIAAIKAAADLGLSLNAGPAWAFTFDSPDLTTVGTEVKALFDGGLDDGDNDHLIEATGTPVTGVVILTAVPSVSASLSAIIQV